MKRRILILIFVLLICSSAYGYEQLGARAAGLGGAFTALADDVNAVFLNPAGTSQLKGEHVLISTKMADGKECFFVGGSQSIDAGTVGLGYIVSADSLISSTYTSDTPATVVNQVLALSFGRAMNEFMVVPKYMGDLSLGASLKLDRAQVKNKAGMLLYNETRLNLDLATVFKPNENLAYGLTLHNKANDIYPGGDKIELELKVGLASYLFNKALVLSFDAGSFGFEWRPKTALALRAGKYGSNTTAGIGLKLKGFGLDYAYVAKDKAVHYLSLSLGLDEKKEVAEAINYAGFAN